MNDQTRFKSVVVEKLRFLKHKIKEKSREKEMVSRRLQQLAQPKIAYNEYQDKNSPMPNVYSGQNPIWPISRAALNYVPTKRILGLSTPSRKHSQRDFLNLDENGDPTSVRMITESTKQAVCSKRIEDLARPSRFTPKFDPETFYSKIRVPSRVLQAVASPRITALASPKQLPNEYYIQNAPRKSKRSETPTRVSSRITQLATPSARGKLESQEKFEKELRRRLLNAMKYRTKPHDFRLSRPARHAYTYIPNKTFSEAAVVRQSAKLYLVTERMIDLAQPRLKRLDIWEQEYNPNAFIVSAAALTATANERINLLSKPVSR